MARMIVAPILSKIPEGLQLEILSRRQFATFVKKRFRMVGDRSFDRRMRKLTRLRLLRPLLRHQRQAYYSPFQIVLFHHAENFSAERIAEFERLTALMHELQDLYMPEVRSNGRTSPWIKSRHLLTLTHSFSVAAIRDWRKERLTSDVNLTACVQKFDLSIDRLKKWRLEFAGTVMSLDPMLAWEDLVAKIAYDERQKLKYEALLAQDYRELSNFLILLLRDLGALKPHDTLTAIFDLSARDGQSGAALWLVDKYGRDHLDDHFFQLELITNDYDLNPKPRAIILTEGDERRALARLFRARGFDPTTLGIEFRSLFGIGDFKFHNWRAFIEYMHEKQVLIYFVIDSERPDLAQQIADFTLTERRHPAAGLTKVIPKDRICKWQKSFEESNFSDEEIAKALSTQGKTITVGAITAVRNDPGRTKGLIRALGIDGIDKTALDLALIDELIATEKYRADPRPVEKFVDDAGQLIAMNHQPTHASTIALNRKTGHLG